MNFGHPVRMYLHTELRVKFALPITRKPSKRYYIQIKVSAWEQ